MEVCGISPFSEPCELNVFVHASAMRSIMSRSFPNGGRKTDWKTTLAQQVTVVVEGARRQQIGGQAAGIQEQIAETVLPRSGLLEIENRSEPQDWRHGLHFRPRWRHGCHDGRGLLRSGEASWLRLHEKGGKQHEMPAHHTLEEYMDAYIKAAGIADDSKGPLFRTAPGTDRD